jgi:Histidine kinase-, DNA gyrase B-, and HSP90-like ATPase
LIATCRRSTATRSAGHPVIFAAQNTVFNVWRSFYPSYQPAVCDGGFTIPWLSMSNGCAPTYSTATRVSVLALLAVVLVLVAWCCWIAAGRALRPLSATAESDRGLPGKVPVRLDELAGSVLDAHLEMAGRHGVSLRRRLAGRLVPGDRLLLERLVGNLVTNAIAYNQPGGWVEVVVAGRPALIVRNSGERIPAEAVSSLFEPFRRLTADRTSHGGGVGLGLSIVRSIATAHGGTIQARPRPEGGLTVEIDLPGKPKPPMTLPSWLPTPLAGGGWG